MRIAVFSGSFNPIHNGHISIAREVLAQGVADELWFLVSPQNPLKKNLNLYPEKDRLMMVQLAVEDEHGMIASDFEFHLPRPSYTIRTLESLKISYPDDQFLLLIGGDNFAIFHKWVENKKISDEFGLIVYPRPGFRNESLIQSPDTIILSAPSINLSATEIRRKLIKGESIKGMVPGKVEKYLTSRIKPQTGLNEESPEALL